MHQLYRGLSQTAINLYYWWLDYLYISYRQVVGSIKKYDAKKYISSDSQNPSVIVLPGIYERWHFMKPIADSLYSHGYSVHVIESLGYNVGSVERMAERVEAYIQQNHIKNYSIVAHSKGGLVAKYLLPSQGSALHKVITINTPFGGSKYAAFFPLRSIRSFLPNSEILMLLAADTISNHKITSIYGVFDPHIPNGSYLEGAKNIKLQTRGHFLPVNNLSVHAAVLDNLK